MVGVDENLVSTYVNQVFLSWRIDSPGLRRVLEM